MAYRDLRDFMAQLEQTGDLRRVTAPVSPHLEMTALCDRVLRAGGPALLFENPAGHTMPVLGNLFGTTARVARAMGVADLKGIRELGELLARLKEPEAPKGLKDLRGVSELARTLWNMTPKVSGSAPCQAVVWEGADVDLARLPVQHCWPAAARRTSASTRWPTLASRFRWRWRWAPIRQRFWVRSPPCPTACPNTSLPACCVAAARK